MLKPGVTLCAARALAFSGDALGHRRASASYSGVRLRAPVPSCLLSVSFSQEPWVFMARESSRHVLTCHQTMWLWTGAAVQFEGPVHSDSAGILVQTVTAEPSTKDRALVSVGPCAAVQVTSGRRPGLGSQC